ncbi:Kinesin-13A [Carex littledalei]|uniref:Kinesin-13A n=1 Tax=Carex littledalei TaxID=544730 RepID=A0A833QFZ3_9POAL|nr:Kinesin-13A [Carex littledalei]
MWISILRSIDISFSVFLKRESTGEGRGVDKEARVGRSTWQWILHHRCLGIGVEKSWFHRAISAPDCLIYTPLILSSCLNKFKKIFALISLQTIVIRTGGHGFYDGSYPSSYNHSTNVNELDPSFMAKPDTLPENVSLKPFPMVDLTEYVERHNFVFDAVLDEDVSNDEVYRETVEPVVPAKGLLRNILLI